jgi:hypothetical protein
MMSMLHLKIGLVLLFMYAAVGFLILVGRDLVCIRDEMNYLSTLSVLQPAGDHHRHNPKPPGLIAPIYHHHQHRHNNIRDLKMPPPALPRLMAHRIDLFEGNVNRRGRVRPTLAKKHWEWPGKAFHALLVITFIVAPTMLMIIYVAPIMRKITRDGGTRPGNI